MKVRDIIKLLERDGWYRNKRVKIIVNKALDETRARKTTGASERRSSSRHSEQQRPHTSGIEARVISISKP